MVVEERDFRLALRNLFKGVIVLVGVNILRAIACWILGDDIRFLGMTLSAWVGVVFSFVIVGFLVRLYEPIRNVVSFLLLAFVKAGKVPGAEKYRESIVALGEKLTLLVLLLSVYGYLLPVLTRCNSALFRFSHLTTVLNLAVLCAVAGILVMLWRRAHPLIDLLTGHFTDKVSALSSRIAYVACPACGDKNDRDAQFCVACGASLRPQAVVEPAGAMSPPCAADAPCASRSCSQCGADNPAASKFCFKCGSPFPA